MSECEAVHKKSYNMMEQEFLRALTEAKESDYYFYRGQVNSQFTKSLSYFVLRALNLDGNIVQSQCECEAGAGPFAACKHVGVLCYALVHFKETRKWPIKLTVTQMPQMWHLPKKRKLDVSPMKADKLTYEVHEFQKQKRKPSCLVYDPRPKTGPTTPFQDNLRNAAINSANAGAHPFGLSGVFECASTAALVKDHDYLKDPLDTQIVKNFCTVSRRLCRVVPTE